MPQCGAAANYFFGLRTEPRLLGQGVQELRGQGCRAGQTLRNPAAGRRYSRQLFLWHRICLYKIPPDPWGHDYLYECPGRHFPDSCDLSSAGPDGIAGTEDDLANWQ